MIEIMLQHERPDGTFAKVVLEAKVKEQDIRYDGELAELLFWTEVGANESGDIQASISIKED